MTQPTASNHWRK